MLQEVFNFVIHFRWVLKELELEVESDKQRITIIKNNEDEVTT